MSPSRATAFPTTSSSAASATARSRTAARSSPVASAPRPARAGDRSLGANAGACAARCLNPGTPQGQPRIFRFDAAGDLCRTFRRSTSVRSVRATSSSDPNSLVPGSTLRNTGQLAPGLHRYTANLLLHYRSQPRLQPFIEAKYVHVDALQEGQPSFIQGTFPAFFGGGRGLRCDNPFLTAANIAQLQADRPLLDRWCRPRPRRFRCRASTSTSAGVRKSFVVTPIASSAACQASSTSDWSYEAVDQLRSPRVIAAASSTTCTRSTSTATKPASCWRPTRSATRRARSSAASTATQHRQRQPGLRSDQPVRQRPAQPGGARLRQHRHRSSTRRPASSMRWPSSAATCRSCSSFPAARSASWSAASIAAETAYQVADPLSASGGTFFNAFQEFDPPALKVLEAFGEDQSAAAAGPAVRS